MPSTEEAVKEALTLRINPALAYALRLRKARKEGSVTAIAEGALMEYFHEDVERARKELAELAGADKKSTSSTRQKAAV